MADVNLTATEVSTIVGLPSAIATRLLAVATAMVEQYAEGSDIPGSIMNEATLRCAGWLAQHPAAGIRQQTIGDVTVAYTANRAAMRESGAMAILSSFKSRRCL